MDTVAFALKILGIVCLGAGFIINGISESRRREAEYLRFRERSAWYSRLRNTPMTADENRLADGYQRYLDAAIGKEQK